jgi:WS/DGAT/MGAT family acyltransferase
MEIFAEPLHRERPLWDFVVIEGLPEGRAAMVQRIHHTLTDGEGGLRLSMEFIDLQRDAPEPEPLAPAAPVIDEEPPMTAIARLGWDLASSTARAAVSSVAHPSELLRSTRSALDVTRSTLRQARIGEQRLSTLWTERSLQRRLDIFDVPLADVKAAANRLGGSVNDAFVTAAAEAAGVVHRNAGHAVDGLRMAMPISTRSSGRMGNQFAPSQTVVPAGDMPLAERFGIVHELLAQTRSEPALTAADGLAGAANLLPAPLLREIGYRVASTVDFVTSNMRAAPFDVYLGGALMTGNYPIGPLAGTAFNMTTMSYRGQLCIGVVTDPAAVPDGDGLVRELRIAFRAIVRAR